MLDAPDAVGGGGGPWGELFGKGADVRPVARASERDGVGGSGAEGGEGGRGEKRRNDDVAALEEGGTKWGRVGG